MRHREALDPEIVLQILFAVKRAAIGLFVFFVLDAFLVVLLLGSSLQKILSPQTMDWIGDGSLRIAPILGALIGAWLYNERLQMRFLLIGLGLALGTVVGVVVGRSLMDGNVERQARFLLMVFPVGTVLGGWLGNLVFTRNDPDRRFDEESEDETPPEDSPMFDRELDG
jgi:hypothetical protein